MFAFHCIVSDLTVMCVNSGALTSRRFSTTPFKRCLGEENCSQGSQNGCLCWGSKKLKQWWCNDGGWGDRREALQSSMEESERERVWWYTTHTCTCLYTCATKMYSNIHECAHTLIYTYVCTQRLTCLQFSLPLPLSFFLSLSKHSGVLCSLTWSLSKGKENPDCWNRGPTTNRPARL